MGFRGVEGLVRDTSKYILGQIYSVSTAPIWRYYGDKSIYCYQSLLNFAVAIVLRLTYNTLNKRAES